ncbi:unnamed protein product, partial [Nesidiocoris tenuis]
NGSTSKCVGGGSSSGGSGSRLAHARHVHREVCTMLVASYDSLHSTLQQYIRLVHPENHVDKDNTRNLLAAIQQRTAFLHSEAHWERLRVKRFAEGFFVLDNPRQSAAGCYDQNYQTYLAVSELAKRRTEAKKNSRFANRESDRVLNGHHPPTSTNLADRPSTLLPSKKGGHFSTLPTRRRHHQPSSAFLRNGLTASHRHHKSGSETGKDSEDGGWNVEHTYEEVRLPPPSEFRDLPPPEPFRDPPAPFPVPGPLVPIELTAHALLSKPTRPTDQDEVQLSETEGGNTGAEPIDNLLYHMYETVRQEILADQRAQADQHAASILHRHSSRQAVTGLSSTGDVLSRRSSPLKMNSTNASQSQSNANEDLCECYSDEKRPPIISTDMEDTTFHKSKEEFKKQINITGMIYR